MLEKYIIIPGASSIIIVIIVIVIVIVIIIVIIHSFIHSGHFYSAPSSPLLLRGAPDYNTDTVSEFHAEAHRQL